MSEPINPFRLRYSKAFVYLPDMERSRPLITDEHKAKAAETPPHAVPFHCKPWVDGQTAGYTLYYGYFTPLIIRGLPDGRAELPNIDALYKEAKVDNHVEQFAPGFVSYSTGYTLRTEPGMVSMILPPTKPIAGYDTLIGVVETDWFPKEVFIVIKAPPAGKEITINYKDEIGRIVVIPRQSQTELELIPDEEVQAIRADEADYRKEENETSAAWTSATGISFTHVYKMRSRRYLGQHNSVDEQKKK